MSGAGDALAEDGVGSQPREELAGGVRAEGAAGKIPRQDGNCLLEERAPTVLGAPRWYLAEP